MKRKLILAVSVVVLGLGAWQGVAVAGKGKPYEPIEQYNSNCGISTGGTQIGYVKMKIEDGVLRVDFVLQGAIPNRKYTVELYDNDCNYLKKLGAVRTDSSGNGNKRFSTEPYGVIGYFATGYDGSSYNDSLIIYFV